MTPPAEAASRVFISYAHKDGAALAQRLQADLRAKGFDTWLDNRRLSGGASWTNKIEEGLDAADYVLALLTPGSYLSEICRAEQLRALRKGKCLIPLLAQTGTEIPLHLEPKNYRDFTNTNDYAAAFAQLLDDIQAGTGVSLRHEFRTTYVTAPPLPVNFVDRPEALEALREALITDGASRHIALTALEGMGGIGKTVLAQALCHDEVVQQAFPDGVIWVSIGKEPAFDTLTRMREVGKALGDDLSRYDNELGARNQYRTIIREKAALIVVDDVWRSADLEPLRAESSPRSRLLFTTRDANIAAALGAREHLVDVLSEEQSREVLASWSGQNASNLPPVAASLIRECGRLPLALSMVGAMLRNKPPTLWQRTCDLLRKADLEKIKTQFPDYPHPNLFRAIQVSLDALDDALDPAAKARYLALAALPEDMAAPPPILQCLWGVDEAEAIETAEQFVSLSLAQRTADGAIQLHDLQLDYVRAQHQGEEREALNLVREAVQLSSHVIGRDPGQFPSQITGRLLLYRDRPAIASLLARVIQGTRSVWLRPLQPALHPPGTSLRRTLSGHASGVTSVAVTPDGRHALSASNDRTVRLWDLDTGAELRTLSGHTDWVNGVALTPDGRRALSASDDHTLKLWDLDTGAELRTLSGHTNSVNGVAVTPDGRHALSASDDNTLKLWDLDTGAELRILSGHTGAVRGLAVTPDGRRALSASQDKTLKLWDLDTGAELRTLSGHTFWVNGVAVTPDGRRALSASLDKTLKLWDLDTGAELRTLSGHTDWVNGVALTPDGRRALSASDDHTLKLWDLDTGAELRTLSGHTNSVNGVAVTPDGRRALSASRDNTLKLWDLDTGVELRTLSGHTNSVNGVAVTPDGRRALSASEDYTLKLWDLETGAELRTLSGHTGFVCGVAMTPDGRRALSASEDKTLKLWDLNTGAELRTLSGHTDWINGVTVTPDGRRALSASNDNTLKLWNLDTGAELRTLSGHTSLVCGAAVTPDGHRALSASLDNTLTLWDLDTGKSLATFSCEGPVLCCAFCKDRQIIAGDNGGHVHFLSIEEPGAN